MQLLPTYFLPSMILRNMTFVADQISSNLNCTLIQVSQETALSDALRDYQIQILVIDLNFPTPEQVFHLIDGLRKKHPEV